MSSAVRRGLADAISRQAIEQVSASPSSRGADWRQAVVDTVNADGTVTTTDGVIARRASTYLSPAAADVIVVTVSGSGQWMALGRLASGTSGWTTLPLAGGWAAVSSYYTPAYRLNGDGTASLCGLAQLSGTLADGATVATLPTEARPAKQVRAAVQVATGYFGVMTILTTGVIQLGDYSAALPGAGNKWAEYDCFGRYRLA
ncbi:hypothetical protein [Streptomyces sp. NBC_01565]|uniref:hypothetical protein n=1 Tax=Streptomyces sp. NBC_01565 TaxID=2975881 RepID=UPI00225AA793|nr:hypothetical protein [Streptomyces sp. NBC_01565]MCX4543765.1 hypothetical protein [Streptomyces sp. NBC_01565]